MTAPIILFVLFVISTYFIVKPFLSSSDGSYLVPDTTPSAQELQKISLLRQIREVEFEREMGITTEEDFHRIRSELVEEVGELLKPQKTTAMQKKTPVDGSTMCARCSQPVSPEDKFCGHCGQSLEKPRCGTCGEDITPGAKFCSGCGVKII